jgi:hypothetical protein
MPLDVIGIPHKKTEQKLRPSAAVGLPYQQQQVLLFSMEKFLFSKKW